MTRVVTYARFSSDMQNEKSITDQQRNCHEFAEKKGWSVVKDYVDKAIAGRRQDRPEHNQLIKDAELSKFDIIIVDDLARLSRHSNAATAIEDLKFHNVRVISVSDNIDSFEQGSKLNIAFKTIINNHHADMLKVNVHRGIKGNALNDRNTGGRSFGYKLIPIFSETEKDVYGRPAILYSDTAIEDEQAKWVKQIYEWVVETRSYKWIANELNKLKVPTIHGGNWTTSTLCGITQKPHSGIINNPIYIGMKYWNRQETQHHPSSGKSTRRMRDESEWVVRERPDLRIISDELWDNVKKEQKKRKDKTASKKDGKNHGARTGPGPKFLLSGLIKCSMCGSTYIIVSPNKYGCGSAHRAGSAICTNKEKILKDEIEKSLISSIQTDLFQPEVIEVFRKEVALILKDKKRDYQPNIRKLQSELKSTDKNITKLLDVILTSDNPPQSILLKISNLETKKSELDLEIKNQSETTKNIEQIIPRSLDKYRELVKSLPESCKEHIPPLREKVSKLLGGEVFIGPKDSKGERKGEYRGSFSGLLELGSDTKISDGTLKRGLL